MSTPVASHAITVAAGQERPHRARLRALRWACAASLLLFASAASAALEARTRVVAWGGDVSNEQLDIPFSLDDAVGIAVPYVLRANGDVLEIGTMPPVVRARNAKAIAATFGCLLVLRRDGTVTTRGDGGVCAVAVPTGLSNVVAIDVGSGFALALKSNGRVVAWGDNTSGQTDVPVGLRNVIAIAAGRSHALALRSDRQVVGWGGNFEGELDFPPGLADVVAIDVGNAFNLALKSDGTVVAWGDLFDSPRPVPLDLPPARALGAGEWRQAAVVLRDGTVREWGFQEGKVLPPGLGNVKKLAMGFSVNYALVTRPITPAEAIADLRVDLAGLPAIEDADRSALNSSLDLATWAISAHRTPLACTAMRSFGERVGDPSVMTYPDRLVYFVAQTRDVLRLMGCGVWSGP